jgi:hypothetical protein
MKKLLLLVVPVLLTGCATKVAFTPGLIDEYKLDGEALKDLQFYTSDKITLTRAVTSEVTGKEDHHLKRISDKYVEVVTIRKDTPGRITEIGEDAFKVCFEDGGVLNFSAKPSKKPYKEHTGSIKMTKYTYYRLTPDGKLSLKDGDDLSYGVFEYAYYPMGDGNGESLKFASFDNKNVYLKVDRDSIEHLNKTRKLAPGCTFDTPCAQN